MRQRIGLALLAIVLAIAFVAYKRSRQLRAPPENQAQTVRSSEQESATGRPAARPSPSPSLEGERWQAFERKYGPDLEAEYSRGVLVSVRRRGAASRAPGKFDPQDAQPAIARAREILDALKDELRIAPEWPLQDPLFQGTPHSAQVHFRQVHQGIPVAPLGGVTVLLGPGGELERVDSSALPGLPGVKVTNEVVLTVDQARGRAVEAFFSAPSDWNAGPPVEGGTHVIWIARSFSDHGPVEGRHAYDFTVGGDQIVIDAQTGAVLHRKTKRRH